MRYDPERHHRRSIRLKHYDYAQPGAYFVTIRIHEGDCMFGDINNGEMRRNELGEVVVACWNDLPNHYPHVELDAFVVMPNHVHGIVVLNEGTSSDVGAGLKPAPALPGRAGYKPAPTPGRAAYKPTPTGGDCAVWKPAPKRHGLPEIVRAFKTFSARSINKIRGTAGNPVWQRDYYEHVVRSADEWNGIREYIGQNPLKWDLDRENPNAEPGMERKPWEP